MRVRLGPSRAMITAVPVLALLLLLCGPGGSPARAEEDVVHLTLGASVSMALARNHQLRAGEFALKKAVWDARRAYGRWLIRALRRGYLLLAALVLVLAASISLIPLIGVEMFGEEDFDQCKVLVKCPEGTSLEETDRIMGKFETKVLELPESEVQDIIVNVGLLQGNEEWLTKKNVGQILLQLRPKEMRTLTTDEILAQLRARTRRVREVLRRPTSWKAHLGEGARQVSRADQAGVAGAAGQHPGHRGYPRCERQLSPRGSRRYGSTSMRRGHRSTGSAHRRSR